MYKVGDKVRVKRASYHGVKFGAVCEVVQTEFYGPGDDSFAVSGPIIDGWAQHRQVVGPEDVKPAKQARGA